MLNAILSRWAAGTVRGSISRPRTYFEDYFGFSELIESSGSFENMQMKFVYNSETGELESLANKRRFASGRFTTPSLRELRSSKSRAHY